MVPIDSYGDTGLSSPGLAGGGLAGRGLAGGGGGQGFTLPRSRTLRGRINVAVPAGVILPEARGGMAPYTYSVEDLPAGAQFTAGTRALSGTPSAAGNNTVTYKVEDSTGAEASTSFQWSVLDVLSTDAIMLQDFDGGKVGYGVSDFVFAYAATFISGNDPSFSSEVTVISTPPRDVVGSVVSDPFEMRVLPTGGIISRIVHRAQFTPDRFRIFDSDQDLAGNPVDSDIGAWGTANPDLNLYLQRALNAPGVELEFDTDRQSGAVWNITFNVTAADSTWIRSNLADDDQFIMVIAEPP